MTDLDRALSHAEAEVAVARRALPIREDVFLVAARLVERAAIFQVQSTRRLICCRRWQLGGDAHRVDRFLQCVDLVEIVALWRFLGRRVALIGAIYRLRVALDYHWLEWRHLLLGLRFADIGRRRGHAGNLAHLSVIVALRLLRGVIGSFNLLLLRLRSVFQDLRSLLIRQVVILYQLVFCILLPLFIRESVIDLVLQDHFLEGVSIDALPLIVTEDHLLWL